MMEKSISVFISYAHEDEDLRKELDKHLSQLKWQNLIDVWHDRDIGAGTEWEQVISAHLNTAQIILLLISPDFMFSRYCYSVEMKRAMERHQAKNACIIPIILRPVDLEGAPFSQLQALPTDATPIVSHKWHSQDEAFVDVVKGLRKVIKEFVSEKAQQELSSSIEESSYIGKQIGEYSLFMELGSGTYGRVYWGQCNASPSRSVAVKVMHPVHLGSPEKQNHFLQEIQFLCKLKHPDILPIIDTGFHEELPYIVTEFADHGSLREHLHRHSPLPIGEALFILTQIGQALSYAHGHDIIHRDLKPENILFDAKDRVLLADFNTAIIETVGRKRIEIAGTAQYMAPEQFTGHASKASDQYALGCIAYELFTGQTPFPVGSFPLMMFQHRHKTPPPLAQYAPQIPPYIERAVLRALAKELAERHPSVWAFIEALHNNKEPLQEQLASSDGSWRLRRLPIYFLLDCSQSMEGDPITAVNEGMAMIHRELMIDPQAMETVYISIITFSTKAEQYQLAPIDQFQPPVLVSGGAGRATGEALRLLAESIEQDLVSNTVTQHGDFRPLVFLLTDGIPTDSYHDAVQRLKALRGSRKPTIVALGAGSFVDPTMLHEITENVFSMKNIAPGSMRGFFQWISGSIEGATPLVEEKHPGTNFLAPNEKISGESLIAPDTQDSLKRWLLKSSRTDTHPDLST